MPAPIVAAGLALAKAAAKRKAVKVAATAPWGKIALVVVVLMLLPLVFVGGLVSVLATATDTDAEATGGDSCYPTVQVGAVTLERLTPVQNGHASTIVAVGQQRAQAAGLDAPTTQKFIRIGLMTAAQESNLKNYANDGTGKLKADQRGVTASMQYPHDAVGRDHGSVNVFQQQYPWWGTIPELMNPEYAAGKFFDTLLQVDGWQGMAPTVAAQKVQRSAFPNAYAKWEGLANEILAAAGLAALPVPATPGQADLPLSDIPRRPLEPGRALGLADAYARCQTPTVPADFEGYPAAATAGEKAVNIAASQIGVMYSWGGGGYTGPSEGFGRGAGTVGYDCSGLVMYAWYQAAGIRFPHSSAIQARTGTPVSREQARAGDLLSFNPGGGAISHIGIYDGRGGMIHTNKTGTPAKFQPDVFNSYWGQHLVVITRPNVPGGSSAQAAGDTP